MNIRHSFPYIFHSFKRNKISSRNYISSNRWVVLIISPLMALAIAGFGALISMYIRVYSSDLPSKIFARMTQRKFQERRLMILQLVNDLKFKEFNRKSHKQFWTITNRLSSFQWRSNYSCVIEVSFLQSAINLLWRNLTVQSDWSWKFLEHLNFKSILWTSRAAFSPDQTFDLRFALRLELENRFRVSTELTRRIAIMTH